MQRATARFLVAAAVIGVGITGYGVATATTGTSTVPGQDQLDDDGPNEVADSDAPLTGTDLERAVAAALEHTGGGEVTDTEIGDDGAAYGVEIRAEDGSEVEVNLDSTFTVIGSEADDD